MANLQKGMKIGPYQVTDLMPTKGGMSTVVRASDIENGHEIALKVSRMDSSDPQYNNALRQEVDILKQLQHPGIVNLVKLPLGAKNDPFMARAIELPGSPWFYAMEFLKGEALSDLVRNYGGVPFRLGCLMGASLADALQYMHQKSYAHLDIKPENILLRYPLSKDTPVDPVLIDFGIAANTKLPNANGGGSLVTMAPERLRQTRKEIPPEVPLNLEKMDVYSLGVVVYRLWTGNYPFDGWSSRRTTNAIINQAVTPPKFHNPVIPEPANQFMLRWLSKKPENRPTMGEVRQSLLTWAKQAKDSPELNAFPKRKGLRLFKRK